jgi:hypothetical protein
MMAKDILSISHHQSISLCRRILSLDRFRLHLLAFLRMIPDTLRDMIHETITWKVGGPDARLKGLILALRR